jgi:hypothetical protein
MFSKIKLFFTKEEPQVQTKERSIKELTRENLALIPLDIYYVDDPLLGIPPDKRLRYLKKFADVVADKDIMERFKFLINKQVRLTMQASKDDRDTTYGSININGMSTIKDDFERLANSYVKESVPEQNFNKFNII